MKCLAILFALILVAAASPTPQLFPAGYSPLLARYAPAPEAPANTVHASHVAAVTPAVTYSQYSLIAPYPYSYVRYAVPDLYSYKYAYY